jgi:hypothetical protein
LCLYLQYNITEKKINWNGLEGNQKGSIYLILSGSKNKSRYVIETKQRL